MEDIHEEYFDEGYNHEGDIYEEDKTNGHYSDFITFCCWMY